RRTARSIHSRRRELHCPTRCSRVSIAESKIGIANLTSSMPITESDIEKIAQLAHLEITQNERKTFAPQISEIVTYVEQLNAIDTNAVEPALGGLTPQGEQTESSRADEAQPSLGQKVALDQAPDPASGHFRVPKVL